MPDLYLIIKQYCHEHDITLGDFAKLIGVSQSKLSHVMHNVQLPNDKMKKAFDELGIKYDGNTVEGVTKAKDMYIAELIEENKKLRYENKLLRYIIYRKIDSVLAKMISNVTIKNNSKAYKKLNKK